MFGLRLKHALFSEITPRIFITGQTPVELLRQMRLDYENVYVYMYICKYVNISRFRNNMQLVTPSAVAMADRIEIAV
jgi:hypothetical protein